MRPTALAVVGVVAAFALGVGVGGLRSDPAPPAKAARVSSETAERGGGAKAATAVVERDHTEGGARATAITYATASQDWLYLGDQDIDASVRAIATDAAGASLSRETVAELRVARDALAKSPGRVWWLVRPLASRVEHFDSKSAQVVVWTVTILSAADVALPQADWVRVAVDLVWTDGAWRLQAITDTPGPTPMTGTKDRPWQPEPFDEALGGFDRVSGGVRRG